MERSWWSDQINLDKYTCFYFQRCKFSKMLNCAERHFLHTRLYKNWNNPKKIFRICNSLPGRRKDLPLPPSFTNQELGDNFNTFFITKIANIRNQLKITIATMGPLPMEMAIATATLDSSQLLTSQDVAKVILSSPSKSCESDPIPTNLLKAIVILKSTHWACQQIVSSRDFPNQPQGKP